MITVAIIHYTPHHTQIQQQSNNTVDIVKHALHIHAHIIPHHTQLPQRSTYPHGNTVVVAAFMPHYGNQLKQWSHIKQYRKRQPKQLTDMIHNRISHEHNYNTSINICKPLCEKPEQSFF